MKTILFPYIKPAFPPTLPFRKTKVECQITFDENCEYDHGDVDQYDWNKLVGLKTKYLDPHYCTAMIGHRWNIEKQVHEMNVYTHDVILYPESPSNRFMGPVIHEIPSGGTVNVSIEAEYDKWIVTVGDFSSEYPKSHFRRKCYLIRDYFGGTKPPPHLMTKRFSMP